MLSEKNAHVSDLDVSLWSMQATLQSWKGPAIGRTADEHTCAAMCDLTQHNVACT